MGDGGARGHPVTDLARAHRAAGRLAVPPGPTVPRTGSSVGVRAGAAAGPSVGARAGDVPRDDDEDLESSGAVGLPVIESILGGTVISVDDDPTH